MPHSLRSYCSRQPTALLESICANADPERYGHLLPMVRQILSARQQLLERYSRDRLALMSVQELNQLLNSPQLRICDLVASRQIMADILELIPDDALQIQAELSNYLRQWENFYTESRYFQKFTNGS